MKLLTNELLLLVLLTIFLLLTTMDSPSVAVLSHPSSQRVVDAAAALRKTKTEQHIVTVRIEELHREIAELEAQKASDGAGDLLRITDPRSKEVKQLAEQIKAVEMDLNYTAEEEEGLKRQLLALDAAQAQV